MPTVLSINAGQDLAGISIRTKQAFDRYAPGWTFRSLVRSTTYIGYPTDADWSEAEELWRMADLVHLHNNFRTAMLFESRPGDKPSVIHHHGTAFRDAWASLLNQSRMRRSVGLASTLDLYLMVPSELEWLPAPYDLDWLASLRQPIDDGVIRIATAPTDRTIKSTDAFLAAVDRLSESYPVEAVLIERADWMMCLREKAAADIYFDQVRLGYGCNAVEAWGMGIPVVAGASMETLAEYRRRFGSLPFMRATETTIYNALLPLVQSSDLREEYAQRGLAHVRRFHDERVVVTELTDIYERVLTASAS